MKALVKTEKGIGHLCMMDMPVPVPAANEVLVEVKASGLCGTDVHVKHDRFPYWPPVVLGHEFAGVIVACGNDCRRFSVGDRVVGEPHTRHCGHCRLCRTGNVQICPQKRSPGWGINGSMAEYLVMPEQTSARHSHRYGLRSGGYGRAHGQRRASRRRTGRRTGRVTPWWCWGRDRSDCSRR